MWIQTHRCLVCMHSLSMHHLQKHINQDIRYKKGDKAKIRTQRYIKLNTGAKRAEWNFPLNMRWLCVFTVLLRDYFLSFRSTFSSYTSMRGSRKICQRGSDSDVFFLLFFYEGREGPNSTKRGPSSARQRNAI